MTGAVLRAGAWPVVVGGNILLGFAAACAARTRTGDPGAVAGTAVVLVLMAPALVPDTVWWTVLAVCAVAIAVSVGGRGLPRGCPVFHDPGNDGLEASRTPPCGQPHPPRRPTPFCLGRPVRSVDGTYPN
jgi:hypothetical protein